MKKTSNKNKIPRNKNRSIASPPMKRKGKKKLAETDKGVRTIIKVIKTCSDNLAYKNLFKVSKIMLGKSLLDVVLTLFSDFEHVFVQWEEVIFTIITSYPMLARIANF